MVDAMITELLLKVAGSILASLVQKGAAKLLEEPAVSKAIDAADEEFPQYDGTVRAALRRWCASPEFMSFLENLKAGQREISDAEAIASFVDVGGFYAGTETNELAEAILETFTKALERELYATGAGMAVLAGRQEVLHADAVSVTEQTGQKVVAELTVVIQQQFSRIVSDETGKPTSAREQVFQARVDEARNLRIPGQAGHFSPVAGTLTGIISERFPQPLHRTRRGRAKDAGQQCGH